jgi:histidine triad (HIT) family protein
MQDSLFTKIIKGEIPAYKIYEDDKTIAFLDIDPTRYGHTLVVPKKQVDQYVDLPDEDYVALWLTVKKVAKRLRTVLGSDRVALKVIGVDIPHAHVHLIPFSAHENHYKDDKSPKLSASEFIALAEKLRM